MKRFEEQTDKLPGDINTKRFAEKYNFGFGVQHGCAVKHLARALMNTQLAEPVQAHNYATVAMAINERNFCL